MSENNISFKKCDYRQFTALLEILKLTPICNSCEIKITEKNFGAIFNYPNRICCSSLYCLNESIEGF